MVLTALIDDGNEILVPAPDYPLWTGAATLAGGDAADELLDGLVEGGASCVQAVRASAASATASMPMPTRLGCPNPRAPPMGALESGRPERAGHPCSARSDFRAVRTRPRPNSNSCAGRYPRPANTRADSWR